MLTLNSLPETPFYYRTVIYFLWFDWPIPFPRHDPVGQGLQLGPFHAGSAQVDALPPQGGFMDHLDESRPGANLKNNHLGESKTAENNMWNRVWTTLFPYPKVHPRHGTAFVACQADHHMILSCGHWNHPAAEGHAVAWAVLLRAAKLIVFEDVTGNFGQETSI